ncbi:hypothetical protein BN439_1034 [Erwinia amylovora Ea644]|nr:hypothetical protein BN439_1034 [Erwinia amylovora Ea644]
MYAPNISGKPYLITDNHRDSPVGFGVKVSATKKTYIIQRRVSGGGRTPSEGKSPSQVIRATIGNVTDFWTAPATVDNPALYLDCPCHGRQSCPIF